MSSTPTAAPEIEPVAAPPGEDRDAEEVRSVSTSDLVIDNLNIPQPPVPGLSYDLDRVLFNPGVYQLQDPASRVYNFDPYLENVMPVESFDFDALKEYKTSSEDAALRKVAVTQNKKFLGSTSSMTSVLAHFHYLFSNWRPLNLNMLSHAFQMKTFPDFTMINKIPSAVFLRFDAETKTYAIDADKEFDSPNVLMMLGKSMEKLLTLSTPEFERYRKGSTNPITQAEKDAPESFEYTSTGNILMRSQLDAYDPRLPGTGMFDLKTRAVLPIRMNTSDYERMSGYEIHTLQGDKESYEREYYDMIRSTMLKYSLQVRMGRMDGIFVAYHNIRRIFGFQYISVSEMDRALHGQVEPCLGDREFKLSLKVLEEALELATQRFPDKSLRVFFETSKMGPDEDAPAVMYIFAEPVTESQMQGIQGKTKAAVQAFEQNIMGMGSTDRPAGTPPVGVEVKDEQDELATELASPAFSSSTSPAGPIFNASIAAQATPTLAPLFAATIISETRVNGTPCDRPQNLKREDDWTVEYILKEATEEWLPEAEKWAKYEDCKTKRRVTLEKTKRGEEEEGGKEKSYMNKLREMSDRGRKFRKEIEGLEKGREKVVVGMPDCGVVGEGEGEGLEKRVVARAESGAVAVEDPPLADAESVEFEGVKGYMDWLYDHQKKAL